MGADQEEAGDGKKSITWHEVDAALGAEKPVFAFLVDEEYTWEHGEEQDRLKTATSAEEATAIFQSVQSLQEFKRFLSDGRIRETFTTPADLAEKVVTSLSNWLWESRASEFESPASQDSALDVWREKLEFLRTQDAIISDPAQRFTVQKQIEEAETKIHELGGQSRAPQSPEAIKYYLDRLTHQTAHLTLLGMGRSLQIDLPIQQAFVPLRTTLARNLELRETDRSLTGHAEHEEDVEIGQAFRKAAGFGLRGVVLLGEPGSGKTTGARQIAWRLASGQSRPEDLGLPAGLDACLFAIPQSGSSDAAPNEWAAAVSGTRDPMSRRPGQVGTAGPEPLGRPRRQFALDTGRLGRGH